MPARTVQVYAGDRTGGGAAGAGSVSEEAPGSEPEASGSGTAAAPGVDGASPQYPPRRWWALAVIGLSQLMVVLDATIVNIALPSAQQDLGFDNNGRQWVVTAYSLAFGSLLLLGGRLADLFGRRRTFLAGLVGFAGASALGGAADSFSMLVVARALQGLFGAVLAPSALSLLTTTFTDPKERSKAFGVFGAIAGSGGAIGLVLGGLLTEHLNWRWTLYVNDVLAVLAVLGAVLVIRHVVPARRPRLDLLGTLLVSCGLFGVVYGFSNAETHGWDSWMCRAPLAAGVVLVALFVGWEKRTQHPLLPLRVLADRNRAGSYLTVFVTGTGMFGVSLFVTYYFQTTLHYSPVRTGIAFLPMVGMLMATAQLATNVLVPRFGPKPVVPFGMALGVVSLVVLTRLDADSAYAPDALVPLMVLGVGFGLMLPPAISLSTLGVDRQDQGVASATVNTMQQVGGSVGTALFNTVAAEAATDYARSHQGTPDLDVRAALHSYATAYWWAAGFFAAGLLVTLVVYRRGRPHLLTPGVAGPADGTPAGPGADASGTGAAADAAVETGRGTGAGAGAGGQGAVPAGADGTAGAGGGVPGGAGAVSADGAVPGAADGAAGSLPVSASGPAPTGTGVRGRLLNTGRSPVRGAAVTLVDPAGRQLARDRSTADGRFTLTAPGPGSYVLVASAPGRQPQVVTVQAGPAAGEVDLVLPGSGGLSGTVTAGGAPVAGAVVVATDARGDVIGTTVSSEAGTYQLSGLTSGPCTLVASAPEHQPTAVPLDLRGTAATAVQDVELQPAAQITGRVRDAQGTPLGDVRMTLLDAAGEVLSQQRTDEDGAYTFTDLPEGHYTVVAVGYPPRSTTVTVQGAGVDVPHIELRHED